LRDAATLGSPPEQREVDALSERAPLALPWLRSVGERYLLPLWFTIWSLRYASVLTMLGTWNFDAHIYYRGAQAWLAGGSAWAAYATAANGREYHFAGLPPTLLLYAPFTVLPEEVFAWGFFVASAVAAVFVVRRLRLAWWWLLFPPLVVGVGSANPGVILLAVLLWGHPLGEAVAAGLKVYAVVPLIARWRWRGLAVGILALVLSVFMFAGLWGAYLGHAGTIAARLVAEADGGVGATAYAWLVPVTLVAVGVIAWLDLPAAGWLAVPALWPSAQFHYAVMALPVISPLTAVLFAVPIAGMPAVAVVLYAWAILWKRVRGTRSEFVPAYERDDSVPELWQGAPERVDWTTSSRD
jgi:hypothetical protein